MDIANSGIIHFAIPQQTPQSTVISILYDCEFVILQNNPDRPVLGMLALSCIAFMSPPPICLNSQM